MPTLYLTCGLPGSGKTSLAKIIASLIVAMVLVFRPQGLFGTAAR